MSDRIPDGYGRDGHGRLIIAGRTADDWAAEAGDTPLFLYDRQLLDRQVARFRSAMPAGLRLHYAVKANPFGPLLAHMASLVDGFDVASGGELGWAMEAGMPPGQISFAGPGKRNRELEAAIAAGATLNVESASELERAGRIAEQLGRKAKVALRINPPFDLKGSGMRMGGGAKPFGVDWDQAPRLLEEIGRGPFSFHGFHVFAGSQNLDADALLEAQRLSIELVAELAAHTPEPVRLVNLGGGFGVPYFPADRPLDIERLGRGLGELLDNRPDILSQSHFAIELGRWLVAEAGVYLTRIVDRKLSAGQLFAVTDGGLHHQLAASGNFGTVVRRNYPLVNASHDEAREVATVVGCLCTPLDRLGEKVEIAAARPGDLIAIFMAGAYGRTASPEAFLGHPPPLEMLV